MSVSAPATICRLAYARFAAHHQRPALTRANSFDERVERLAFAAPAL
jgi:hypothetical protein